jgi:hypothetical protein
MTFKCQKCQFEWNSRTDNPRQCPHCDTRNWRRIDQVGISVVSNPVVSDDKSVVTPSIVTPVVSDDAGKKWKDSIAAPGAYQICAKHGKRYCRICAPKIDAEDLGQPGVITRRYQKWSEMRKLGPLTAKNWPYMVDAYNLPPTSHSAAVWTDVWNQMERNKPKKGAER